jgi:hypothetical protein
VVAEVDLAKVSQLVCEQKLIHEMNFLVDEQMAEGLLFVWQ